MPGGVKRTMVHDIHLSMAICAAWTPRWQFHPGASPLAYARSGPPTASFVPHRCALRNSSAAGPSFERHGWRYAPEWTVQPLVPQHGLSSRLCRSTVGYGTANLSHCQSTGTCPTALFRGHWRGLRLFRECQSTAIAFPMVPGASCCVLQIIYDGLFPSTRRGCAEPKARIRRLSSA